MLTELMPEMADAEPGKLAARKVPSLRWVIMLGEAPAPGAITYEDLKSRATDATRARVAELTGLLQFDDPINIQFTSGTTGTPKAATLTHHNIVNNAFFVGRQMALVAEDRLLHPGADVSLFRHGAGHLVVPGSRRDRWCWHPRASTPRAVLETIEAEHCTALHGVPTMFIAELDEPGFSDFDLASLRTGIIAGAPCPVELMKRLIDEMQLEQITIAYGMTETGPVSFQTSVDDPVERRVETVGRVLPHTEIKIVDDQNRVVPRGTPGELMTRGYCVMPKYWDDPEKTAKAIDAARWIASGDIATIDEQGYCRIVGRIKDMLIRGGENIYPREIEEFLFTHPKIDEVEVIGVPDPKFGEEICAWIRLREGKSASEDEMPRFLQGAHRAFQDPALYPLCRRIPDDRHRQGAEVQNARNHGEGARRRCRVKGHPG